MNGSRETIFSRRISRPGSGKQRPIQILLILLDNSEADTHIANLALLAHMLADKELTQALIDTDNPAAIRTLIARALSHSPA
ncbi:MAG TPA: PTS sugar transporter subunit IIA [Spirochaetota bacterium]|nr:PTS sugar transporter subunit IIA [Spirochaetota bacterium]